MNYNIKRSFRSGVCIGALLLLHVVSLYGQTSYSELEQQAIEADERGDLQTAISLSNQMLDVAVSDFGKSSEEYRVVLYNLGSFYREVYDYRKSLEHYRKAAERYKEIYDQAPTSTDNRRKYFRYEDCLIGMAETYDTMGDTKKAEELYLKVLELSEERTYDPIYWQHLQTTASFYVDHREYASGLRYYQKNLDLIADHYTKDSFRYVDRLVSLAFVYLNIGQIEKSKLMFREAQAYFETRQTYGRQRTNASIHPVRYISTLQGLGLVSEYLGNQSEAIQFYDQNIAFIHREYGDNSFYQVYPLINKSSVYEGLEDYENAIDLLDEALIILQDNIDNPNHDMFRNIYLGLGRAYGLKEDYEKAREYLEKSVAIARRNFGEQSYEYGQSLYSLAVTYDYLDQEDKAEELFLQSVDINYNYIKSNFTTLTAEERTSFWNGFKRDFENVQYQVIDTFEKKPSIIGKGYNYLLKSKAFLLQNTEGFNRAVSESDNPQVQADFNRLRILRSQIASSLNLPESVRDRQEINLEEMREEVRRLEQSIAKGINFSSSLIEETQTWQDIQKRLKEDEAAIEITRAREYSDVEKKFVGVHYAAYLLTADEEPQLIKFPESEKLEEYYLPRYREAIQNRKGLTEAYRAFWQPLEQHLQGKSTIYFSPDGAFHQINLNTLRKSENGTHLLDKYDIQIVTKTSEILNKNRETNSGRKQAVLFDRPDYSLDKSTSYSQNNTRENILASASGNISRSGLEKAQWTDLPGTEKEVRDIESMLSRGGWAVQSYLHETASEDQLKNVRNPRVLHIATHGFFTSEAGITSGFTRGFKPIEKKEEKEKSEQENPVNSMMQSGLVFSGVENFFQGRQQTEDGILTAYEASGLLLNGTELVVLSACETGLGEVSNGEGIYGLQRAFKIAGAESIIMSLWKVDDRATQEFMIRFYENWLESGDKRRAFIQTQRQIRSNYESPYYWGAFVMVGS